MKFTTSREALLRPLQLVTGVVERRQTLPVLANLLVVAGRRDEARERLQRVLRLYRDSDPALRETRREAEAALARLDAAG